jgi:RNA polymerase primary sigma factor
MTDKATPGRLSGSNGLQKERPRFNPLADILAMADEPVEELGTELRPTGRCLVPVEKTATKVLTLEDGSIFVDSLDDAEEKEIGLMNLYSSADSFLRKTAKYRLLTAEEEVELGRRVRDEKDLDARNELVVHNTRLVVSIARRYMWSKLTFDDLFQEGLLGLIIGAEKYDHSLGYRFTTYATWWIRQAITRAISNTSEAIRVPVHVQEVMAKIRAYLKKNKMEEFPSPEVLAKGLGLPVEQVKTASDGDTLVDDVSPESLLVRLEEEQRIEQFIDREIKLRTGVVVQVVRSAEVVLGNGSRDFEIFKLMCGVNSNWSPCTLEEAGQKFGITRERVRQILKKTLETLKARGVEVSYEDLRDCCSKISELQKLKG